MTEKTILPRIGQKETQASKGGLSYYQTDNTDQNLKNNKHDLFFYDVNNKGDKGTFNTEVKNRVFSINEKIQNSSLDPNDPDNKNNYNHLENAINLASCGAWNDRKESLCVNPWGNNKKDYNLVNFSKTPNDYRDKDVLKSVKVSLDEFAGTTNTTTSIDKDTDDPLLLKVDGASTNTTVSKQEYYNGMAYMINKYLLCKSRFYNSNNALSYGTHGFDTVINLFKDNNINSGVKLLFFVILLLSLYLILKGLGAITFSNTENFKLNGKNGAIFSFLWIGIMFATVIPQLKNLKNYYSLYSGNNIKLNESCKNPISDQVKKTKYIFIFISVFLALIYLYFMNKFSESKSGLNYFGKFLFLFGFSILICYTSTPQLFEKEDKKNSKEFRISYLEDKLNELPYQNKDKTNIINISYWIGIFIILLIVSIYKAVVTVFTRNKEKNKASGEKMSFVEDIAGPWLLLRGPFIIAFNIILIYLIPYYIILYPIICMLQRMFVGSFILPHVLKNIPGIELKDEATKLSLFNSFVGWDLPGWSFFKIADVLKEILGEGGDVEKILKDKISNTSNYKVFSEFDESFSFVKPIGALFLTLFPGRFLRFACGSDLSNNYSSGYKFVLFLFGLLISIWLFKIIITYFAEGVFDLSYIFVNKDDKTQKNVSIASLVIYLITYIAVLFFSISKLGQGSQALNYPIIKEFFNPFCESQNTEQKPQQTQQTTTS